MIKVSVTFMNGDTEEETAEGIVVSVSETESGFRQVIVQLDDKRLVYGDGYSQLTFQQFGNYVTPLDYTVKKYTFGQPFIQIVNKESNEVPTQE